MCVFYPSHSAKSHHGAPRVLSPSVLSSVSHNWQGKSVFYPLKHRCSMAPFLPFSHLPFFIGLLLYFFSLTIRESVLAIYCLLSYLQCMANLTPSGIILDLWTFGCRVRWPCPVIAEKNNDFYIKHSYAKSSNAKCAYFHISHSLQSSQIWDKLLSICLRGRLVGNIRGVPTS